MAPRRLVAAWGGGGPGGTSLRGGGGCLRAFLKCDCSTLARVNSRPGCKAGGCAQPPATRCWRRWAAACHPQFGHQVKKRRVGRHRFGPLWAPGHAAPHRRPTATLALTQRSSASLMQPSHRHKAPCSMHLAPPQRASPLAHNGQVGRHKLTKVPVHCVTTRQANRAEIHEPKFQGANSHSATWGKSGAHKGTCGS